MSTHPHLSFCTSADGTRLAMAVHGAGRAVVMVGLLIGDDLDAPGSMLQPWIDGLANDTRFVCYDARACGLSDRDVDRYSLDAWTEDLDAVLKTLGPEPVVLIAHSTGSLLAVRYASLHPERVSHLVVYGGISRGKLQRATDAAMVQETQAHREAILSGWGSNTPYSAPFRAVFINTYYPHASDMLLAEVDALTCRRWTAACAIGYASVSWETDITAQAERIGCPTLVLHPRGDRAHPFEEGRRLAALIPGARFLPIETDNHMPLAGDPTWPPALLEIRSFLALGTLADRRNRTASALTPRQTEVLRLVGAGQTDKQIARSLGLSPRTVEMHVANAIAEIGARTRAEAVQKATSAGWLA